MKTRIVPPGELSTKTLRAQDYVEWPTLLTIDWDYFVPEDPLWDIGHVENQMFLTWVWQTRFGLLDKMQTSGEEVGFWARMRETFNISDRVKVFVSDSHAYAWQVAQWVDRVVSFDAHHDCWEREPQGVHCHDWLRCWLEDNDCEGDSHRKAFWMPPLWTATSKCADDGSVLFPLPEDMAFDSGCGSIEWAHPEYEGFSEAASFVRGEIEFIHICRSGCWTPPWLDKQFIKFVDDLNATAVVKLQDGPWDPLVERWGDKEYAEAKQAHEVAEAAMRRIRDGK